MINESQVAISLVENTCHMQNNDTVKFETGSWDAKFHFKLTNKTNSVPTKALPDEDKLLEIIAL
jgi:hypothetical protein